MVVVFNKLKSVATYIGLIYPRGIIGMEVKHTHLYIWLDEEFLKEFLFFIRKHSLLKFESLLDVWGVDFIFMRNRFEVNYLLTSLRYNLRVILKVRLSDTTVDSISDYFFSAGWLEREVWDMFGVYFVDHRDLRRILTDYGFEGFPLRKDFPLSGYREVSYDDGEKRVISSPVKLLQEFRNFVYGPRWDKYDLS